MSILDNEPINQPDPAKVAAQRLVQITRQTYQQMVNSFNQGSEIFWDNRNGASPGDIASELGNNAKEVFELHYKLGQLLATVNPNSIAKGVDLVGNFTINEDGTVTINN